MRHADVDQDRKSNRGVSSKFKNHLFNVGLALRRSELVAVSHQVLHGEPELALGRAMELSGLISAVVATDRLTLPRPKLRKPKPLP